MEIRFDGVYSDYIGKKKVLLTKNLVKGKKVYGERLLGNGEYREWIPNRSKLAAAIIKGLNIFPFKRDSFVLYLGASSGTTVSHISDIADRGYIFALEFSPRMMRELLVLCRDRKNIIPLLENANKVENYKDKVVKVDIVYQDIAQKNQVEIFFKNIDMFLKPKGYALLALKARSIDVNKNPKQLFSDVKKQLESKLKVLNFLTLEPLEKDHAFFVCQKK